MTTPEIFSDEEKDWVECLKTKYGITVIKLSKMTGFSDPIYRVNGDYVARIYMDSEINTPELINAETEMLSFLKNRNFPVPEVIKTLGGASLACFQQKEGAGVLTRQVRVQTFLHDSLWFDKQVLDTKMSDVVGEFIGRLDLALQDFHNEYFKSIPELFYAIRVSEKMDVTRMTYLVEHDAKWSRIVKRIIELFNENVVAHIDELPKQQVHCDINWRNLMVNDDCNEITGVIDFADSKYTVRIYELAIALATVFLDNAKSESFDYAEAMIKAYTKHVKLTEFERSALLPSLLARMGVLALGTELLVHRGMTRIREYNKSLFGDIWKTMEVLMDDYENGHRFQAIVDSTK